MDRRAFLATAALPALYPLRGVAQTRRTDLTIRGDAFLINGRPTYAGRTFNGKRIEGLLMNVRVVQGIFDDLNAETASRWVYPTRSAGIRIATPASSRRRWRNGSVTACSGSPSISRAAAPDLPADEDAVAPGEAAAGASSRCGGSARSARSAPRRKGRG